MNNINNNIQNVEDTLRSEFPQVAWQHGSFTDYIKVDPLKINNRDVYTFRFQTLNSTLDNFNNTINIITQNSIFSQNLTPILNNINNNI